MSNGLKDRPSSGRDFYNDIPHDLRDLENLPTAGDSDLPSDHPDNLEGTVNAPDAEYPVGHPSKSALNEKEQNPDTVGRGYTDDHEKPSAAPKKKPSRFRGLMNSKKRRILAVIISVVIAVCSFFMSILSGPAEFVSWATNLNKIHLTSINDAQDNRLFHEIRYLYYAKNGVAERARLGYVGNKVADKFESNMKEKVGFETKYDRPGNFRDRIVIDTESDQWKGKTDEQIKTEVKDKFGVEATRANGELIIDAKANKLDGYLKNRKFNKALFKEVGYKGVSGAITSHFSGKRLKITFHPIKKLDNKIRESTAAKAARVKEWAKERYQTIKNGAPTEIAHTNSTPDTNENDTEKAKQDKQATADALKNDADGTLAEGQQTGQAVADGDTEAKAKFTDSIHTKIAAGGMAAVTLGCIAKGIDKNSDAINAQNVTQLKREAGEMRAVGDQVKSGNDIDLETLGNYKSILYQKPDPAHNVQGGSATEAASYKAEIGEKGGTAPDDTLTNLFKGTPFHFLNEGALGASMGIACSSVVQGGLAVISFIAAPATSTVNFIAGSIAAKKTRAGICEVVF